MFPIVHISWAHDSLRLQMEPGSAPWRKALVCAASHKSAAITGIQHHTQHQARKVPGNSKRYGKCRAADDLVPCVEA